MEKRGRVLRNPHEGQGLLMVEGKQYPFLMEGLWRSKEPAKPGLAVNVGFDAQGNLNSITAISESRVRPQDGKPQSPSVKFEPGFDVAGQPRSIIPVTATALLLLSWIFLNAVSIHLPSLGKLDLTGWQLLGALNARNLPSIPEVADSFDPGILGFMAVLALAGPLLSFTWKDRRALLAGTLPLGFLALVASLIRSMVVTQAASGSESLASLHRGVFRAISLGFGGYVSLTLSIYLAVVGVKQFMGLRRARE